MVSTKNRLQNVRDAFNDMPDFELSADEHLDILSFSRNFLNELNTKIETVINSLQELTWIKDIDEDSKYEIRIILSEAERLYKFLNFNITLFKNLFGTKLPEIINENECVLSDLKEVIEDVYHSIFIYNESDRTKDMNSELLDLV